MNKDKFLLWPDEGIRTPVPMGKLSTQLICPKSTAQKLQYHQQMHYIVPTTMITLEGILISVMNMMQQWAF
jgi:hypothetical protein